MFEKWPGGWLNAARLRDERLRMLFTAARPLTLLSLMWVPVLATAAVKQESFVDVPVTLAAVRSLHSPPRTVVKIETVTESSTFRGGPCHGPVCFLYMPLLLAPDSKYEYATVTSNGELTYAASFAVTGDFISAVQHGEVQTRFDSMHLPALQRDVIVATVRFKREGARETSEPVSIQSQVDLLGAYTQALAKTSSSEPRGGLLATALRDAKRADLLAESASALRDEALPLLNSVVRAEGSNPAMMARLAEAACLWETQSTRDHLLRDVLATNHWQVGQQMIRCDARQKPHALPAELLATGYQLIVRALCGPQPREVQLSNNETMSRSWPLVAPALSNCPKPRSYGVRAMWGQSVTAAEVRESFAAQDQLFLEVLSEFLSEFGDSTASRRMLLSLVVVPSPFQESILSEMQGRRDEYNPLTAEEMRMLAAAYVKHKAPKNRLVILEVWNYNQPLAAELTKDAITVLEAPLAQASQEEKWALEIALVVLGQHERALSAARAFGPFKLTNLLGPVMPDLSSTRDKTTTSHLVERGLIIAGCKADELPATHRRAARGDPKQSDVACTRLWAPRPF